MTAFVTDVNQILSRVESCDPAATQQLPVFYVQLLSAEEILQNRDAVEGPAPTGARTEIRMITCASRLVL